MTWESQYLNLMSDIIESGEDRTDRTGTGTRALFSKQLDIDVSRGFPLVTTKKMPFKMIVSELLWFLEGSTDERRLAEIHYGDRDENRSTIWTANAQAPYWTPKAKFDGDLGRVYGAQWRSWRKYDVQSYGDLLGSNDDVTYLNSSVRVTEIDQIAEAIRKIRTNPTDRRIIVSAWNVGEIDRMALPPCHYGFQFFVSLNKGRRLSIAAQIRSSDVALGLPFNVASYALLLMMIAQVTNCTPHRLIINTGDTHLYNDHIELAKTQIDRNPFDSPIVLINPDITSIDDFKMGDFALVNYESHDAIPYKMST